MSEEEMKAIIDQVTVLVRGFIELQKRATPYVEMPGGALIDLLASTLPPGTTVNVARYVDTAQVYQVHIQDLQTWLALAAGAL